jgi:hypothetical protein
MQQQIIMDIFNGIMQPCRAPTVQQLQALANICTHASIRHRFIQQVSNHYAPKQGIRTTALPKVQGCMYIL